MEWEVGVKLAKYIISIFVILIFSILLFTVNLQSSKIQSLAVGQGWYMFFEYSVKNDSFVVNFGYMTIVVPVMLGILFYFIKRLKKLNHKK